MFCRIFYGEPVSTSPENARTRGCRGRGEMSARLQHRGPVAIAAARRGRALAVVLLAAVAIALAVSAPAVSAPAASGLPAAAPDKGQATFDAPDQAADA